ncbi:site-specific DNA-methyltransferase [Staphylococcus hyicus]|uniref:DNA-methyltransferase n=1 Tax=Staphylococcus hyicus TaxID=1284 RepID=UPI00208FBE30|nr:site-specific DNA-methyltransferase [Staphylococcus hyicus]MCO4329436.1 site-specific DNA-methyltransferase [Staphylococcus hyicus]MCO4337330.1 site-specific DNA-methyltransferase [Staphylococcus hyicus]
MLDKLNYIERILGTPYYKDKKIILYNMDSLEALKKLNTGEPIIDLTVTSPPYNIGKEYEKIRPIDEYVCWSEEWMDLVYKNTKNNGSFWLNVGYIPIKNKGKAIPLAYLLWDKTNFFMIQELVWNYGAGVAAKKSLSPRNEKLLWFVKNQKEYTFNLDDIRDPNVKYPNQKKNGKIRVNPLGKNPSDVWQIPKVTSGKNRSSKERVNHPAQTPIELFKRLILASSNENELVLDPFIGSGTTAVIAKSLDRYCIGFDLNKDYLEIAIKRINEERIIQSSLF